MGGIEAQLRGSQISAEAGFAPAGVLSEIQQGEFNRATIGGQAELAQQDFENVYGQEQQVFLNFMSTLMAELDKMGIDLNAFLGLTGQATSALTGQTIFVPQVDLTSQLQQEWNRQAARPDRGNDSSFSLGFPGVASYSQSF